MGEIRYVAFYLIFFTFIAALGSLGSNLGSGVNLDALPTLDESEPDIFSSLFYGWDLIIYFIGLQGLTVAGVPLLMSVSLAVVLNAIMAYVIVRLVRGGG